MKLDHRPLVIVEDEPIIGLVPTVTKPYNIQDIERALTAAEKK